jgi:hypothetical protein
MNLSRIPLEHNRVVWDLQVAALDLQAVALDLLVAVWDLPAAVWDLPGSVWALPVVVWLFLEGKEEYQLPCQLDHWDFLCLHLVPEDLPHVVHHQQETAVDQVLPQ